MNTLFNKFDLIRLSIMAYGILHIYNTIGAVAGVEQTIISLASLQ